MAERDLDKHPNPWYKEPWPWILMAGPLLAVIGCIVTIYLAFTNNNDAKVHIEVYRQGKFVSRDGKDIPNVFGGKKPTLQTEEQKSSN